MLTQIQTQIHETIKQIVHLDRVKNQLGVTKQELKVAKKDYKVIDLRLGKELKDIERLEGLSTKAIFYKILGSKEKQLEKERQEYLEMSLKEEDLKNTIHLLEYEENLLEAKITSRKDLERKLEKLKSKREVEIVKTNPTLRKELLAISNKVEDTYSFKSEVEEALEVGKVCHNLMQRVVSLMSKVTNWGQWPVQQSNPHVRRRMRKDAIDRARNLTYQVKHHLTLFQKELEDVGKQITFNTDTAELTQFSDFFFGNLITDWIQHQQLTRATESANMLYRHLNSCVLELMNMKEATEKTLLDLNNKKDEILTS